MGLFILTSALLTPGPFNHCPIVAQFDHTQHLAQCAMHAAASPYFFPIPPPKKVGVVCRMSPDFILKSGHLTVGVT